MNTENKSVRKAYSEKKQRNLIVLIFGSGVLLFTLMTVFPDAASVFAFSGLALMIISAVLAVINGMTEGKKGLALVAVAVFAVLGFLVASFLLPVGQTSTSYLRVTSPAVERNVVAASDDLSMARVGQDTFGFNSFSSESTVLQIASDLVPVEGPRAENLIREAKDIGYKPKSNVSLEWQKAQVHEHNEQLLVSVPFRGREDLEIVNRVVFFIGNGEVQVSEVYMTILSEDTFEIRNWVNSKLMLNRVGTVDSKEPDENATEEAVVLNAGMDWKALDRCLSNQGIGGWALAGISLLCGGACVVSAGLACPACIGFATGFGASFVEKCVRKAWT